MIYHYVILLSGYLELNSPLLNYILRNLLYQNSLNKSAFINQHMFTLKYLIINYISELLKNNLINNMVF